MGLNLVLPALRCLLGGLALVASACSQAAPPAPPSTVSPAAFAKLSALQRAMARAPAATMPAPDDLAGWKAEQARSASFLTGLSNIVLKRLPVEMRDRVIDGVPVLDVVPPKVKRDGRMLVYVHGGGYTSGSAHASVASAVLAAYATGLPVTCVDYTLAPQGNWKTATAQVVAVLHGLQQAGTPLASIGVFGDSAGGGLVAGSVLRMRDEGLGMPGAVVLWSPWSDITETGDTYQTLKDVDFLRYAGGLSASAAAYAAPADQKNPYVSPVYGDYSKGFPPTLIQGGTREIFLSNFVRHYQAIVQSGQQAVLDLYEGMPHVHQLVLERTPESDAALKTMAKFIDEALPPPRL